MEERTCCWLLPAAGGLGASPGPCTSHAVSVQQTPLQHVRKPLACRADGQRACAWAWVSEACCTNAVLAWALHHDVPQRSQAQHRGPSPELSNASTSALAPESSMCCSSAAQAGAAGISVAMRLAATARSLGVSSCWV